METGYSETNEDVLARLVDRMRGEIAGLRIRLAAHEETIKKMRTVVAESLFGRRHHDPVIDDVAHELDRSYGLGFGDFNSAHEGFAVLLEEVEELKAHVWTKQKNRDVARMRQEAVEVAAMAAKFASVCTEEWGRR